LPSELGSLQQAAQVSVERKGSSCRAPSSSAAGRTFSSGDDLVLLHSAVAKLVETGDHDPPTPRQICAAAGVSRRSFDAHFSSIDECLVAVAIQRVDLALGHAHQVGERDSTPESNAYRRLAVLCDQVASDRALARLCFGDILESGEWLARRDRLLTERVAGLFESAGLASYSVKQPETEASLGAVLGLLQNEVAAGRAGSAQRIAPTLAHLALAPTVGRSSAMVAICQGQR
jgi:AcrR family transcriptional regulator